MFFHSPEGIIALDIDGTITAESHEIPSAVVHYLHTLNKQGWQILFLTGRPFQWGFLSLQKLPFSYVLAVQNGALLLDMPSKTILARKYLQKDILPAMEAICQELQTDFVIYAGFENEDGCYYRPEHWPVELLPYIQRRTAYLKERWQPIQNFSQVPVASFASLKCFAKEKVAWSLSQQIEQRLTLHAPPNRDPFDPSYFVVQATHPEATKGEALLEFSKKRKVLGPIIAAGDDCNDLSLLLQADIKIAMANAPQAVLEVADIIAPSAAQKGIIQGLTEAMNRIGKR